MRRGFTLLEMLVATSVFIIGFVAVVGLFLMGARYRKQADDLLRCSLAAANIVEEIKLLPRGPDVAPRTYVGRGVPGGTPDDTGDNLYPYAGMTGVWYRVEYCAGVVLNDVNDSTATGLQMRLLVLTADNVDTELTLSDLNRQLRVVDPGSSPRAVANALAQRGIALDYPVTLVPWQQWP